MDGLGYWKYLMGFMFFKHTDSLQKIWSSPQVPSPKTKFTHGAWIMSRWFSRREQTLSPNVGGHQQPVSSGHESNHPKKGHLYAELSGPPSFKSSAKITPKTPPFHPTYCFWDAKKTTRQVVESKTYRAAVDWRPSTVFELRGLGWKPPLWKCNQWNTAPVVCAKKCQPQFVADWRHAPVRVEKIYDPLIHPWVDDWCNITSLHENP